ncbi:MAG: alanine racemase [Bacillota bacterium]|jgi:alanine racemase
MIKNITRPVWAEVDLGAVAHNTREIRRIVKPETKIMAIVKANGYGHGAVQIAQTALKHGADYLGVAILSEAVKLREQGIDAPILVMGYNTLDQVEEILKFNVTTTVFTLEMAEALSRMALQKGEKAKIHIKIDTGMGRIGFLPQKETIDLIKEIVNLKGLWLEGIFTHFAVADETDKTFTWQQLEKFTWLISRLEEEGIKIPLKHAANSAAIIDLPETHLDMVRAGILLYGLYPSPGVDHKKINLIPAMELKAKVAFVKKVGSGTSISYGRKFIVPDEAVIASLPFGYADGYIRKLSNQSEILLGGKRVPVVGTICMDQLMVDASQVQGVKIGDEAVIIGRQGSEYIPVEEIAKRLNTINYEIICMLSERIPRIYLNAET